MWLSLKTVISELFANKYRLYRLASYELKAQNSGTMFGFLWNFFNPALQIFVYWFVFSVGLRSPSPRGEYPYIIWMIVGIIPWFYISGALMASTTSMYSYSKIIKRMALPLAIVPVKTVLSNLLGHFWAMLVVLGIFLVSGYSLTLSAFFVLYYMLCSFVFLTGYSLFASAITVLFKDFQKIMTSVIRLLFYISPVVWVQDNMESEALSFILNLNPFAYIINGYRNSILYGETPLVNWHIGIYFWVFTIILFIIGCCIHIKFRKNFIDLI